MLEWPWCNSTCTTSSHDFMQQIHFTGHVFFFPKVKPPPSPQSYPCSPLIHHIPSLHMFLGHSNKDHIITGWVSLLHKDHMITEIVSLSNKDHMITRESPFQANNTLITGRVSLSKQRSHNYRKSFPFKQRSHDYRKSLPFKQRTHWSQEVSLSDKEHMITGRVSFKQKTRLQEESAFQTKNTVLQKEHPFQTKNTELQEEYPFQTKNTELQEESPYSSDCTPSPTPRLIMTLGPFTLWLGQAHERLSRGWPWASTIIYVCSLEQTWIRSLTSSLFQKCHLSTTLQDYSCVFQMVNEVQWNESRTWPYSDTQTRLVSVPGCQV